ncbi:hypothetical protein KGP96_11680 [Burkholderia multivorans]|uniref:hypothetical protein n=1 Tax=Burkholderia multivorans TaxID=87883 RepID=UPI0020A07962|nr:hypothetical protein [Burkholderia multivorans]MCO8625980.1 hypothetical protein [Burkholderia multivorans]
MLTIPKTKKALTHAVRSKTGALMGAHPSEALALEQAARLNESRKVIDRLNGPYRVEPYRA